MRCRFVTAQSGCRPLDRRSPVVAQHVLVGCGVSPESGGILSERDKARRTGPVRVLLLLVDQVPTILVSASVPCPTTTEARQAAVKAYAEGTLIVRVCVLFQLWRGDCSSSECTVVYGRCCQSTKRGVASVVVRLPFTRSMSDACQG